MYRPVREQLSRDQQQDLLKKLLYQQGMCLLIYPEGSNTTLLTALAETMHTTDQTLHNKLCEKLQQDYKNKTLPKNLNYIYNDPSLIEDFRKYPELVNFAKIILQLFSVSAERRIKVFNLVRNAQESYFLQDRIINSGGYKESIKIAKIENKYYNIKENDIQIKLELSFEEVFKSSTQIDSEELIQTFKPETIQLQKDQKVEKVRFEETKPGKLIEDLEAPDLVLKKAKSSIPIYQQEKHSQQYSVQYEKSSIGETQSLREETQLINECGLNREEFNSYSQNTLQGIQGVMSPQQMYYLYYQSSYYTGKSQTYLNYPQVHPMSPQKASTPQIQSPQLQTNYYPPSTYTANPAAGESSENKRYTGRLKFFDQGRNYGFIIMDADESDIFVHYDDLQKAGISKEIIKTFKNQMYLQIRFSFKVMEYFGKYKKSRKAVQLTIMGDSLSLINSGYPLPE